MKTVFLISYAPGRLETFHRFQIAEDRKYCLFSNALFLNKIFNSGADPELLLGWGANPYGVPTQYFNNIF